MSHYSTVSKQYVSPNIFVTEKPSPNVLSSKQCNKKSYSACPVPSFLFCLSRSVFPVLTVTFCLSCYACRVLSFLFCLSRCAFPVLAVSHRLSFSGYPFLSFCPGYLILAVLCWLLCPGSPIRVVLSGQSCPGIPVLAVLSWQSSWQSCFACPDACPVLPFLFCLSCSACPVLAVLFCLSCSACSFRTVLFCLFKYGRSLNSCTVL
jgi:hypothetical protein